MSGGSARAGKTRPDKPWRRPGAVRYALRRVPGLLRPPVDVYEPEPGSLTMLRDLPVTVRDGTTLRVNVVLPAGQGPFPVLLSAHPYGKDNLPRRGRTGYRVSVQYRMLRQPDRVRFSSLTGWEAPDPAWWAAQGYAVVNCDLRGAGTSEGTADLVRPGGRGYLRPDRMGRGAAVEHRRRWHARRVLPCHLAVGGRGAAAAEPQSDMPVGGIHRRVPGHDAAWGHPRGRLHQDVGASGCAASRQRYSSPRSSVATHCATTGGAG